MQSQLEKAINLVKKTGDRLIIFDPQKPGSAYVVMPMDDYEKIIIGQSEVRGLTEDALLDKINRDIAIWKSEQDFSMDTADITEKQEKKRDYYSDYLDEKYKLDGEQTEYQEEEQKPKKYWNIPTSRKNGAEEIIEEDRQYLEEIKF